MGEMAAALVTARLCEPLSESHIAEDRYRCTALCDLLELGDEEVNKDRLYRGLDLFSATRRRSKALVAALRRAVAVENVCCSTTLRAPISKACGSQPPGAARLLARSLPRLKQVCIAPVVTFDGFLGYEVSPGDHD